MEKFARMEKLKLKCLQWEILIKRKSIPTEEFQKNSNNWDMGVLEYRDEGLGKN